MRLPKQAKSVTRVPVPFELVEDVGLGDVVKQVTSAVGIKPCGGCQRRAESLNRHVVFSSRRNGRSGG
jgi:hypothetical protein